MLGSAHDPFRALQIQRSHVLKKRLFIFARVFLHRFLIARGVADDFVIHVSNIHYMLKFMAALAQESPQHVHGNKGAEVAYVTVIVDRGAAGIHADGIVRFRLELFHLAGKRVVKAQGQNVIVAKVKMAISVNAAGKAAEL